MQFDAIIVGGGIIGCTHGHYLAQRGLKVAVVEHGRIGGGTTARNFSWVNATSKTGNPDYHRLNALSVSMYDGLAAAFGAEAIGLRRTGALILARRSDGTRHAALHRQAAALERLGYPVAWLDARAVRAHEPDLTLAPDTEALLAPADKCLDAPRFARFMAGRIKAAGGAVFENCAALELLTDEAGAVSGLRSAKGEMRAPRVVVAAGPDTPTVLGALTGYDGFATRFPVSRVPGLLVTTPPVKAGRVRHLVWIDGPRDLHVLPEPDGGLRIAADAEDGAVSEPPDPAALRPHATALLERMREIMPAFAGAALLDPCRIEVGIRAMPQDGLSIAGAMPGAEGLFVIVTHSGVTLAPALGQLMAEVVADGAHPQMLRPFGPERLPGFA